MEELKKIIAQNIIELRRTNNMTQLELAEKLNYTDKAVSKWERGESLPDISVLKAIADMFGVKIDYLVTTDHIEPVAEVLMTEDAEEEAEKSHRRTAVNRRVVPGISILLGWFVATFCFVVAQLASEASQQWLSFIFAVPVTFVVWLIFNSIWFRGKHNFLIISLLVWSLLAAIHISCVAFGVAPGIWLIYFLGIPGQAIIFTWSHMMHRKR
ncbi:MAG: helix-turn-helix domain-containing protein [Clostridia bacterium]|nr:helix-turn-helix domain-containing protein [Clostridia bacterium]